ncbi:MAG: PAS domain S-box protein [Rhodomicrobium sp.]
MLEFALNRVHEGAFLIDNGSRFLYVNDEATRSLSYSREELLQMRVADVDPNYPPERWPIVWQRLQEESPFTIETLHRAKDGRLFAVEITASAFNYGGRTYSLALARDITERKRAEEERQRAAEQQAILEFALNNVHEAAFLVDEDSRFLYVNGEAIRALEYNHEELLDKCVADIDPDFPPERWPGYWREVQKERMLSFETRHKTKRGRVFPVELASNYFEYGGRPYVMGLARDITERKRAEEDLRNKTEELDRFFTLSQDLFCIASTDGYFLRLNPSWEQTLGYTLAELQDRPFYDFIHPDDVASTREAVDELIAQKEVINFPNRYRCKDGSYRWIEWRATAVGGRIYGAARDITRRKQQEHERLAHLKFFESMDRINRAIQGTNDLEEMMDHVIGAVLELFGCDRAWLVHPCEPEAPFWRVAMEQTKPEYPGALALKQEIPSDEHVVRTFRMMLSASGPLQFRISELPQAPKVMKAFGIKSQMAMAIQPKAGKPWLFGLHQCSRERIWTPDEERLFQEIGRRLTDALTSLLTFRDLQTSEEFSRTVLESSADCIKVTDPGGRIEFMNGPGRRLMEIDDYESVKGRLWAETWPEKARPLVQAAIGDALDGRIGHFSALCPTEKGTPKWWDVLVAPVKDRGDHIRNLVSTARDITERKAAEQRMNLLMNEVNHRARNLLAVVQAVARRTAGEENPKLFAKSLGERIKALAASHGLIVDSEWKGVDVGKLVTIQLSPFKDLIGSRIILKGPPALLKPPAAQALGMALHELTTNASKYGALSCSTGSVNVEWDIATHGGASIFKIRWSEHGGPPPKEPEHHGFGQKVMVQVAEDALEAVVTLKYPSSGLVWELAAPAERAIEESCATESLPAM